MTPRTFFLNLVVDVVDVNGVVGPDVHALSRPQSCLQTERMRNHAAEPLLERSMRRNRDGGRRMRGARTGAMLAGPRSAMG